MLKPTTKVMVMVKAFSYGLGTYDVAKLLEENNVDYLGVANTFEGIELRKAGIQLPIMIMKPEVDSFDLVEEYELTPTVFSLYSLKRLIDTIDSSKAMSISIKIDTGMHRLGFSKEEVPELIQMLKSHSFLKVESVFSHLVAAEDPNEDEFSLSQIDQFRQIANQFSESFSYSIDRHILNSNGIIRFCESQMEMVRLGIGLYGVCSNEQAQAKLLPASTLKSKIAQVKQIKAGETIGYNRVGTAKKDITIATIPVGYADGLSRSLSDGNWCMLVNGKKAPIVGNICMDMVMIDVSGIDCKEGDEAFIFSTDNPITQMAKKIGTIPYEILTSYSPRVKREFKY